MSDKRAWRLTLVGMAIYIVAFSILAIGRYERYNATGFDLAFYDQILWRTAHGDLMGMTIEGDHWTNWAFHVEPILFLIAPFKLIFRDTRWLLILQTAVLSLGAIPTYRIARRTWEKPWAAFAFAMLYLLYPTVGWAAKFDFHPLIFTTPLLIFAFDAAELKHWRRVSIYLLLAMISKEEVGVVVALFGLYWYLSPDRWRGGLIWLGVGVAWSLVGFFLIIPGSQGKFLLPQQADLRYEWLFHGTLQEKIAYITGPDTPVKFRFLIQLLVPLLFLPLLKPRIFLIASPIIILALLSTRISQSSVFHQYMTDVVPFLIIAAIKASRDLVSHARRFKIRPMAMQRALFAGMFGASLLLFAVFNPFVFTPRAPYGPIYGWESGASLDGLRAAESVIPADSCLTASNNITSHYGQRWEIYVIGIGNYTTCDLVMIDTADTRFASFGTANDAFVYSCQVFTTENFHPIFYQDNVVILKRNAPADAGRDAQFSAFCSKYSS